MSVNVANARGGEHATSRRGGMTPHDIAFLREQRAKGRSVQTIAQMLGRSQDTIASYIETDASAMVAVERKGPPQAPPAAFAVIELVARRHGLFPDELIAHDLRIVARNARQEAYWRLVTMRNEDQSYRWTAGQIAGWFDRDESSVRQGAAAYLQRMADQEVADLARWRSLGDAA